MNREMWNDGIRFLLCLARSASGAGQKKVALQLVQTAILAQGVQE